ncbi:MAG: hypothetical protein ACK41D_08475 [Rubricoccaceae bacterium]
MAVYLLRFDRPLGDPERPGAHASYYIGSTPDARLVERLTEHWRRSDACIVRAARTSGRRFRLVRVWWGKGRPFERKLKRSGHYVRHDPAPPPHVPLTLREEPARYAARPLPAHAGDGAQGPPPALSRARSWAACPLCGGSGRVRYAEPHPATGVRIEGEEPCEMCDGVGYPPHFAEPRVVYGVPFPLGRVLATPGALALADEHGLNLAALIARHQTGDWGTLCDDDRAANERALRTGARLLSRYPTRPVHGRDGGGVLWIITEADRSATTVLLPDEY